MTTRANLLLHASIVLFYCASVFGAPQYIIDAHIHLFDPNKPGGIEWPSPGDPIYKTTLPADYKKVADPLKITGAIVVECSFNVADNQWELDLIKNEPRFYGFIGNLSFGSSSFDADLDKFAADKKFLGLRGYFSSLNQSTTDDLKALAQKGLVLELWGSGGLFTTAKSVATKVPELPVIVDHAGNIAVDGKPLGTATLDLIKSMAPFPKIYCKVSSLFKLTGKNPAPIDVAYYTPLLDALYAAFGADRLVFAGDWPALELNGRTLADELNIVTAYFSAKGDPVLQKVMWKNAVKFYHLPDSTSSKPAPHASAPLIGKNQIACDRSGITIMTTGKGSETIDFALHRLNGAKLLSVKKIPGHAGVYRVAWNANNTPPRGTYLCKVSSGVRDDSFFVLVK